MLDPNDFLAQSWLAVDRDLLDCRRRYNNDHAKNPITDDDVVLLTVMDGIASHKQSHPDFSESHYVEFTARCQNVMHSAGGKVRNFDDPSRGIACGWFANKNAAAQAAVQIVLDSLKSIAEYRPAWQNERHPISAIGRSEYAAFRLLQMGRRDVVVVDPEIWDTYSAECQNLLQIAHVSLPNREARDLAIQETIGSNVKAMQRAIDELQKQAANYQLTVQT